MILILGNDRLKRVVREAVNEANSLSESLDSLKKKLAQAEIDYEKKREAWDRREREIEHKVGLERQRQAFEIQQAKRDTTVSVREENLKAEKERFKSEMDFQRKRLEEEVSSLRELVAEMLKRLPSAEILIEKRAR